MDMNQASITRVHDAILGGKDNFAADRVVRDRLFAIDPTYSAAGRDVREFHFRATRYLASRGITQFLDCGLRIPVTEDTHAAAPGATVVYVSIDPWVLDKARTGLADNALTHVTDVNLSHADRVLGDPVVRKYLDFNRPIGLMHVMTLHHLPDHDDPWLTMQRYIDGLPPGSYVVITHMLNPGPGQDELTTVINQVGQTYRDAFGTGWPRSAERIRDLLPGLELVEPGVVPVGDWQPEHPRRGQPGPMQRLVLGAVARKPGNLAR